MLNLKQDEGRWRERFVPLEERELGRAKRGSLVARIAVIGPREERELDHGFSSSKDRA